MAALPVTRHVAMALCLYCTDKTRPYAVRAALREFRGAGQDKKFLSLARKLWTKSPTIERLEVLLCALIESQAFPEAVALIESATRNFKERPNIQHARVTAEFELGRYRHTIAAVSRLAATDADCARWHHDFLKGAFAAGFCRLSARAMEFFARQYCVLRDDEDRDLVASGRITERLRDHIVSSLSAWLTSWLIPRLLLGEYQRIGVFFLNSTQALGHAILDPYHFLALYRDRYDHILFVGPPRESYSPATRACLDIIEQYGQYVVTHDQLLLNLSWMSLGTISSKPMEFVVEHYWSLLREVMHRSTEANDFFVHNAWHLELPNWFLRVGRKFCAKYRIDLKRPIVVIHIRESGYHGLTKQGYRDGQVSSYEPAIRFLLGEGYQVIRIGDSHMEPLPIEDLDYFELPFCQGYDPRLDPFFIAQARFMIGCQSGPCSHARALGRPLLTVNAVCHYSLLPSPHEMVAHKRYIQKRDGAKLELSMEEIHARRIFLLENSFQFENAGIELLAMNEREILAAVTDMLEWLEEPARPETAEQVQFRKIVEEAAKALKKKPSRELPFVDYIGYSLPGYRIAPSVAKMRAGVTRVEQTASASSIPLRLVANEELGAPGTLGTAQPRPA